MHARAGGPSHGRNIACRGNVSIHRGEQEDEFDVVVYVLSIPINSADVNSGDMFVVISRARGWCVVQRDHTGTSILDSDTNKSKAGFLRGASSRHVYTLQQPWQRLVMRIGRAPNPFLLSQTRKLQYFLFISPREVP
ncbi:hypothetical protein EDB83DRAFT_356013 [Lactarius deliciosus]|nr:hypothetical protein EDB83DRAFT_356013 [Lactarius deliciosus]